MALREVLAEFGIKFPDKEVEEADKSIAGLVSSVKAIGGALIGSAVVGGIANFVTGTLDAADAIHDEAAALGVASDELQLWQQVVKQSGGDVSAVGVSMKTLAKNISAAADGNKEATASFKELGISVKDADGNTGSLEDLFGSVGEQIAAIPDESQRAAAALKMFGKQGLSLVAAFQEGPEAIAKLKEQLRGSGGLISEDTLQRIGEAGDSLDVLSFAGQGLRAELVAAIVPALVWFANGLTKVVSTVNDLMKNTSILQGLLVALGVAVVAVAATFGPALWAAVAPLLPLVAGLTAAFLVVEDLITMFRGGDSVIGRFIDSVWGAGTSLKVVEYVKAKFAEFMAFAQLCIAGVSAWWAKHGEEVKAIFAAFFGAVVDVLRLITDAIGAAIEEWNNGFSVFGEAWDILWQDIADTARGVIDAITGWFADLWAGVEKSFKVALDKVKKLNPANWFGGGDGAAPGGGGTAAIPPPGNVRTGDMNVQVNLNGPATPSAARDIARSVGGVVSDHGRATKNAVTQRG